MKCSVFTEIPEGFHPNIEVSGCYCEWQDKLLFLERHPNSPQGNTWGIPAGKMEKNETPRMTVIREVREEVGLDIDDVSLCEIGTLYCRLPHVDFIFHVFCKRFEELPEIMLNELEHLEIKWATKEEALKMPLISGGIDALHYYTGRRDTLKDL